MYLYLKEHNLTGLKYLGFTHKKDPFEYKGSGLYWLRHLDKYGNDVTTKILEESNDKKFLKERGLYYSNLWNIVDSKDFANLVDEAAGGWQNFGVKNHRYGTNHSKETREKMKISHTGKKMSEESKIKMKLAKSKVWKITHPDGKIEKIRNLSEFCRKNNIRKQNLSLGKSKGYLAEIIN